MSKPDKVIAVLVQPGTNLDKGTPLLVIRTMKMEHTISAPRKGLVKEFRCAPGEQVSDGADLVDFAAVE